MRASKRWLLVTLVLLGLLIGILVITEMNIRPIVLSMAESRVRAIALDAVNTAVAQTFQGIEYQDLVEVGVDSLGRVNMLKTNTVYMNGLATSAAMSAQQYIADMEMQPIRISIGSTLGNPLLAGRGPSMLVKVVPVGSVSSEFITEFQSAGINQTRHKIFMRLKATMRIVIPTGAQVVEVLTQVPVAETVIVGAVPESFVNVDDAKDMLNLIPEYPKD